MIEKTGLKFKNIDRRNIFSFCSHRDFEITDNFY
jgi:hypothetical protein